MSDWKEQHEAAAAAFIAWLQEAPYLGKGQRIVSDGERTVHITWNVERALPTKKIDNI